MRARGACRRRLMLMFALIGIKGAIIAIFWASGGGRWGPRAPNIQQRPQATPAPSLGPSGGK